MSPTDQEWSTEVCGRCGGWRDDPRIWHNPSGCYSHVTKHTTLWRSGPLDSSSPAPTRPDPSLTERKLWGSSPEGDR